MTNPPERYLLPINSLPDDWSSFWFHQIGWVGYYFGQLEWIPYLLADRVGCSKSKRKKMTGMGFSERLLFAKKQFLPKLSDSTLRNEWDNLLDRVSQCGKMRNEILHNPLELNLEEIEAHGVRVHQGIRLLKKGEKILGLGDVQLFTKTMISLHREAIALLKVTSGPT